MEKIKITLNGKKIISQQGKTILEVAKERGLYIPTLCHHSDLKIKANCRVCLVEVTFKNQKKCFLPSCQVKAENGMKIETDSVEIRKLRKTNLELLFSQHKEECADCVFCHSCSFLQMAKEYQVEIDKFQDRKKDFPTYNFGPALIFDSSKCINCYNCVEVCQNQSVGYLEKVEKNGFFEVRPNPKKTCIYCGQCLAHCPVGAFEAVGEFEGIEKPLQNKNKVVIFQFAPSIRTSLGEEFNLPFGSVVTEKLVGAIKELGADYIFDVSVGADFTTFEEANELLEKLKNKTGNVLLSSCCPAWVRFVEAYYPQFVKNLSQARPPHIILGGLIKTYFAKKQKIKPENITVVSVMPCVAKKFEIERKEFLIGKLKPVDFVLTTRELAFLFKKKGIDLKKAKPRQCDNPLGVPSGSGVIYGASGGVMESALRVAFWEKQKEILPKIIYDKIRGQENLKKIELPFLNKKIKMAALSGIKQAKDILEELKENKENYSCLEVMACPGGCIGGGGQPLPQDKEIRQKRAQGLYQIDQKENLKVASQNPIVKQVYKDFLKTEKLRSQITQVRYTCKQK
ncbi:[FeFe] hydrogenase, group A [Candidatus Parcubacteria bacterium]|nr:[FeFe] hydrogenase, group A [Candidatus Parcubacteria bacterium]